MSQNRRFIPPNQSTANFLASLQAQGLSHAVLRWFEALPHVEPGEDIDILVADHHAPTILAMLHEHGPGQPIDLYSANGSHGLKWRGASYLPPQKANQLLDRRIHGKACDHPAPQDHMASLAFHVVYHKGSLASNEHDYYAALGISRNVSLHELEAQLKRDDWQPSLKALWHWRRHNRFISARFPVWLQAQRQDA